MLSVLLGVVPAILIRWVFVKKQISMGISIIYTVAILIIIAAILHYMEVKSMTLAGAVAAASFFILRAKSQDVKKENEVRNDKS
ncbi:MAG: hypothetical protein IT277_04485 [Ignavibacteriaceae bacterium]|jgi:uncharacterized membrane protein YjdF|nr:hypothetical protein [Ignavibacteriaceae bacterium]